MEASAFKSWRRRLRLTQEEVGKKFDVSRMTIVNWEGGATRIPSVVEVGCKILDRAHKQRPEVGPVKLVFSDNPASISQFGRIAMLQQEIHRTNQEALASVLSRWEDRNFHNPFIMDEEGEVIWNGAELMRWVREHRPRRPATSNA